jgi:hypothetical protein
VQRTESLLSSRPLYEGNLFRNLFFQVHLIVWIIIFFIGLYSNRLRPKLRGKLKKDEGKTNDVDRIL